MATMRFLWPMMLLGLAGCGSAMFTRLYPETASRQLYDDNYSVRLDRLPEIDEVRIVVKGKMRNADSGELENVEDKIKYWKITDADRINAIEGFIRERPGNWVRGRNAPSSAVSVKCYQNGENVWNFGIDWQELEDPVMALGECSKEYDFYEVEGVSALGRRITREEQLFLPSLLCLDVDNLFEGKFKVLLPAEAVLK